MKPILLFLLLSALYAQAGVVFGQTHDGSGTLHHSSRYQPNGTDYDQFVWDSFSVTNAQAVTEIRWRGGYNPGWAYWAGQVANFHVSIYASIPGLSQPFLGPGYPHTPATLIAYDTGNKAGETSAGVFGGVEMFDYHLTLPTPFQAAANTVYWVQIEAEFVNGIPSWGFANGAPNGSHFRRIPNQADYYFQIAPGNAAFCIVTSDGPVYTIAANASPVEGGSVTNTGLYPENSAAPLIATPNAGYAFVNWTENGAVASTNPNYTFTVAADRTLVANFSAGSLITVTSSPANGGTAEGGGSFVNGSSVTVQAQPAANYAFVNWTENDVPASTNASYTFTSAGDRDLVANFVPACTLTLSSSSTTMGTVGGAGTFPAGETITATATAKPGYVLLNWTENGTLVSTLPSYAFPIITSRILRTNFAAGYTMTAGSSFAPGGTVTGSGAYATGASVTLSASAADGYQFTSWTENGISVSESTVFSFTCSANHTVVAHFVPILGVHPGAPNEIHLSWTASAAGWTIEESPDLSAGSWTLSNQAVTTTNGTNQVTIPTTEKHSFFHLRES